MVALFLWGINTAMTDDFLQYRKSVIKLAWPISIHTNVFAILKEAVIPGIKGAEFRIWDVFSHSVLYAVGCALAKATVTCVTAYLCARYAYKISKIIYTVVLVSMMIPIVGSLPSEIQIANTLGLYNQIWGMWIMRSNFLGLYFLIFYEQFKAMPKSFSEAAEIDGANDWRIMVSIAMPLIKFTFLSVLLIYFIEYWNDFLVPLALMPAKPTAAYALHVLYNTGGSVMEGAEHTLQNPPYVITFGLTIAAPIIILFVACNKQLLGNLSVGGVKG